MDPVVPIEVIEGKILLIRGQKVMLDRDLAALYGVETKVLKQAVGRNSKRFPADFMYVLTQEELAILRSQIVTSSSWGGLRHAPMAFTEQGIAMLSSVLRSDRAIDVNIAIMRTFVKLRRLLESHSDLARKLTDIERKCDDQFRLVFDVLKKLTAPPETPRKQIGFSIREAHATYGSPRSRKCTKP